MAYDVNVRAAGAVQRFRKQITSHIMGVRRVHFSESFDKIRIQFRLDLLVIFGILGCLRQSPDLESILVKGEVFFGIPYVMDYHCTSIYLFALTHNFQRVLLLWEATVAAFQPIVDIGRDIMWVVDLRR